VILLGQMALLRKAILMRHRGLDNFLF